MTRKITTLKYKSDTDYTSIRMYDCKNYTNDDIKQIIITDEGMKNPLSASVNVYNPYENTLNITQDFIDTLIKYEIQLQEGQITELKKQYTIIDTDDLEKYIEKRYN